MVFKLFSSATEKGYLPNSEEEGMDNNLQEQIKRTLHGGVNVPECFNLPFTDIAQDYFQESVPRNLRDLQRGFPAPLAQHACVSPCSVLLSMIYTKRLRQKNPEYLLQISSSDLFFISMMVASKYLYNEDEEDDVLVDEWAEDTDRDVDEVVDLERNFLAAIEWNLFVKKQEFEEALKDVERRVALRAGQSRGWLTYGELLVLAGNPAELVWSQVGAHWLQVVMVSSVAYLAGVMTMVGSTVLAVNSPALATSVATAMSASLPVMQAGLRNLPIFQRQLQSSSPSPLPPLSSPPVPELPELGSEDGGRESIWPKENNGSGPASPAPGAGKTWVGEAEEEGSPLSSMPSDGVPTPTFGADLEAEEDEVGGFALPPGSLPQGSRLEEFGNGSHAARRSSGRSSSSQGWKSLVTMETLLRRLWSLLTLKNTLLQFVSAAADQTLATRNHATRRSAHLKKQETTTTAASSNPDPSSPSLNSHANSMEPRLSWPSKDRLAGANSGESDYLVDYPLPSDANPNLRSQCHSTDQDRKQPKNLCLPGSEEGKECLGLDPPQRGLPAQQCRWVLEVPLPEPEDFSEWSRGFATGSFHRVPVAA